MIPASNFFMMLYIFFSDPLPGAPGVLLMRSALVRKQQALDDMLRM